MLVINRKQLYLIVTVMVMLWFGFDDVRDIVLDQSMGRVTEDSQRFANALNAGPSCPVNWTSVIRCHTCFLCPPDGRTREICIHECIKDNNNNNNNNNDENNADPALTFTANPTIITRTSTTTLSWTPANVTSCEGSCLQGGDCDGWAGTEIAATNQEHRRPVNPDRNTTFVLVCRDGNNNTVRREALVRVVLPPRITLFTGAPTPIHRGQRAQLRWYTENATACIGFCRDYRGNPYNCGEPPQWGEEGKPNNKLSSEGMPNVYVSPRRTTVYFLQCFNDAGTPVIRDVTISVIRLWWREVVPVFPFIEEMLGLVLPPRPRTEEYQ